MKIKPLADRIVIKPLEEAQQKKGSIIIPDTAKEKPQQGKIMEVKKGDKVLYGKYSGTEVTIDGEEYLILRESDVLAVM